MTKGAAIELGPHGVRVNSIHPGIIDTPMMGGTDLDGLVATIGAPPCSATRSRRRWRSSRCGWSSDDNSYSTGAEFVIDGGQTV